MSTGNSRNKPGRFELQVSEDDPDVAYLRLPTHSGHTTKMSKSLRLAEFLAGYKGPDVVLDFDQEGVLVGIEVLA